MKFESAKYQGMLKAFEEAYAIEDEEEQDAKVAELFVQFKKERISQKDIENADFVASAAAGQDSPDIFTGPSAEVVAERQKRLDERKTTV